MLKLLSPAELLAYVTLTNYVAVAGGVLCWAAFFTLGLIAHRLERAFETPTRWRLLLWAPSGLLLYTVYALASGASAAVGAPAAHAERTVAHLLLLASALGCLLGCLATHRLLRALARPDGAPK